MANVVFCGKHYRTLTFCPYLAKICRTKLIQALNYCRTIAEPLSYQLVRCMGCVNRA